MRELTNIFKILSDETRIRILMLLYHKKMCVCQLQGVMEESQPKISKHLGKLRNMGFVNDKREEKFIFYYLNRENKMLKLILENILKNIDNYPMLKDDLKKIKNIDVYIKQKINS